MESVQGGVCAALGFKASGVHCGIRKNTAKKDLMLLVCDHRAAAAAVYTQNRVQGAPLTVTRSHLSDGYAQAMVCNSGNANTCTPDGTQVAQSVCRLVAQATGCDTHDVIVASTGVIGQPLSLAPFETGIPAAAAALSPEGDDAAAEAIMTTDTFSKQAAVRFKLDGHTVTLGGMCKGSGMIAPNMATLLCFLTTDAAISPQMLQKALSADLASSFNMVVVDGDTSTNDMCAILASGAAGNPPILREDAHFQTFCEALAMVTQTLCRMLAADGEGASHLFTCHVTGAEDEANARVAAKAVVTSPLVKAAIAGADANWGRILCALGYSGASFDPLQVSVRFRSAKGDLLMCKDGGSVSFSEDLAKEILSEKDIEALISLGEGPGHATAWGCDLTCDYVRINGSYRS